MAVVVLVAVALLATCTAVIVPPVEPGQPVSAFLVDYGRHASLLLPDAEGDSFVEWTFGEWAWFALDESGFWRVVPVLMWPTRGTLGRRERRLPSDSAAIGARLPSEEVLEIVVDARDVVGLGTRLQVAFDAEQDTRHYQPLYDLDFVHYERSYHLFHNCNHGVADWLEELGCRVDGPTILSSWEVRPVR